MLNDDDLRRLMDATGWTAGEVRRAERAGFRIELSVGELSARAVGRPVDVRPVYGCPSEAH
ncbi:hypothetical protein [Rhizosaccharibacter radicis]|uniref:XRE family transcriptional regulator n=1 Tax=Rhizosaccharibacter radicis TaxID=2782605 RepID=A0ABT1VW22_9PROT|nr:hypothetical protein [Acetobacteraceae bacterium KSS12]